MEAREGQCKWWEENADQTEMYSIGGYYVLLVIIMPPVLFLASPNFLRRHKLLLYILTLGIIM